MVSNQDVGFVHAGENAQIKIETFNFTRYGLMHGRVIDISPDTVTPDKPNASNENTTPNSKRDDPQQNASPSYVARVMLDGTSMMIEGRREPLRPGMVVTAEIKTGSRRILSYLLSPLRKYAQDAIRER